MGADSATSEPDAEKRAKRKAKARKRTGSMTLVELTEAYVEHLKTSGKTESTIFGYRMELRLAASILGGDTRIVELTPKDIQRFYESERVTKTKTGRQKARPGIDKSRRVIRLALTWAATEGLLDRAPVPELAAKENAR